MKYKNYIKKKINKYPELTIYNKQKLTTPQLISVQCFQFCSTFVRYEEIPSVYKSFHFEGILYGLIQLLLYYAMINMLIYKLCLKFNN